MRRPGAPLCCRGRATSSWSERAPDYPPWDHATAPEPWPAVPDHLHSDQMAQLAALEREITQMEAEARKLAGRYLP